MFRAFQLSGLADLSEPVPDFYLSASEREEEAASAVLKDLVNCFDLVVKSTPHVYRVFGFPRLRPTYSFRTPTKIEHKR
jgi:hypothetical protein